MREYFCIAKVLHRYHRDRPLALAENLSNLDITFQNLHHISIWIQCEGGLSIFCSIEASGIFYLFRRELKFYLNCSPLEVLYLSKEHSDGTILFFKPPEIVPIGSPLVLYAAPTPYLDQKRLQLCQLKQCGWNFCI